MWLRPRTLEGVVAAGLCSGCGLCAGAPEVEMQLTEAGHLRPRVNSPIEAGRLRHLLEACPGVEIHGEAVEIHGEAVEIHGEAAAGGADVLWGPVLSYHRAFAADPATRFAGASGGVLSAIAGFLVDCGEVDFVLHVGAARSAPTRSAAVLSRSAADVVRHAGSRYAPAATLDGLEELLAAGRRFAVVAKPCEIAALRRRARSDPRVDALIPYMLSFFCAGVPGHRGTQEALRRLDIAEADVAALRYRGEGWPGRLSVDTAAGRKRLSYDESWGTVLHPHVQFRCKICPDGTGELADIAAADAWALGNEGPDFAERDGVSALLARTARGRALQQACIDAGVIVVSGLQPAELAAMQPYQLRRKRTLLARLAGLAAAGRPLPRYRGMRLWRNALRAGPVSLLRAFAGGLLRALRPASRD